MSKQKEIIQKEFREKWYEITTLVQVPLLCHYTSEMCCFVQSAKHLFTSVTLNYTQARQTQLPLLVAEKEIHLSTN